MATAPYDQLITVLNAVRTRIGDDLDTLLPVGGQLGSNSQAYSQQLVNNAWRKLQQFLYANGYQKLKVLNYVLTALPAVANLDPATLVTLSWTGYSDGVTSYPSVVLPQALIRPIGIFERPSGYTLSSGAPIGFIEMDLKEIAFVPPIAKGQTNLIAAWVNDRIIMPGTTNLTDIRIDYESYLADFTDTGDVTTATGFVTWFEQPVPIMRALDPFADYICAEIEHGRDNYDAEARYTAEGEAGATEAILGKVA